MMHKDVYFTVLYITFNIIEMYSGVSLSNHLAVVHWSFGLDCRLSFFHMKNAQQTSRTPSFAQSKPKMRFFTELSLIVLLLLQKYFHIHFFLFLPS